MNDNEKSVETILDSVEEEITTIPKKYFRVRLGELTNQANELLAQVAIQSNNLEAMKARLNMLLGAKAELEEAMTEFSGENGQ